MSEENMKIELDLSATSLDVLEVLCDEAEDENIFYDIYLANSDRTDVLKMLYDHPDTPQEVHEKIAPVLQLPVLREMSDALVVRKEKGKEGKVEKKEGPDKKESLLVKIQKLSVGERVSLAMRAGKEVRGILIKDTAKEVVKKVLENPKLNESEIELLSKSKSVPEDVLRIISKKKEWMKNYGIVSGIVCNPKTPAGVAMQFVKLMKTKDLKVIEKNKNVSEAVRATAKKLLKFRKSS